MSDMRARGYTVNHYLKNTAYIMYKVNYKLQLSDVVYKQLFLLSCSTRRTLV